MNEWLCDGAPQAEWRVVLAHGAGQGMASPFMTFIAQELARQGEKAGGVRVVRFEFPYRAASRRVEESGHRIAKPYFWTAGPGSSKGESWRTIRGSACSSAASPSGAAWQASSPIGRALQV